MKPGARYGKYVLLDRIAYGGMAEVFKAKATGAAGFEKPVAIKKLHSRYAEDPEVIAMLQDEARLCSLLTHSNICQVFDLGRVQDSYYIAMEYIDGRDLSDVLRAGARYFSRTLPYPAILYVMREVLAGLDYAHRKKDRSGNPLNIIHRDISPQNILVSYEGEVKIIDFGIAKAKGQSHKTEQGVIKGKFRYMSPEQARGEPVDHRADIFAVGVVFYEMVLGRPHSKGLTDMQVLLKLQRGEMEPLDQLVPDVPSTINAVIEQAVAPDPHARWQTAGAFRRELEAYGRAAGLEFDRDRMALLMQDLFPEARRARTRMDPIEELSLESGRGESLDGMPASGTVELDQDDLIPSDTDRTGLPLAATVQETPVVLVSSRDGVARVERYAGGARQGHRSVGPAGPVGQEVRGMGQPGQRSPASVGPAPVDRLESMVPPPVDDSIPDPYASLPVPEEGSAGEGLSGDGGRESVAVDDRKRRKKEKKEKKRRKRQERAEISSKGQGTRVDRPAGAGQESDATQKVSIGRRIGSAVARLVAWVVVLGLLGALGYVGYTYWRTLKKQEVKAEQKRKAVSETVRVTLSITSRPSGALIIINGKTTGLRTPNDLLVDTPSPVAVELRKKGYPLWVDHVPVGSGETVPIEADLRHPPRSGLSGAQTKGTSGSVRHKRQRRHGSRGRSHRNHVSRGGGQRADDRDQGRIIRPGQDSLAAHLATIEISANRRAWVYINGRRIDYTKLVKRVMPGTYRVWVSVGPRRSRTKVVHVAAGQVRRLHFDLNE